jgi:hypothetical protein
VVAAVSASRGRPEHGGVSAAHGRRDWSEPGQRSVGSHGASNVGFLQAPSASPRRRGYAPSAHPALAVALESRSRPMTNGISYAAARLPARAPSAPSWAQRVLEGMRLGGKKPSDVGCGCGCNGAGGGCETGRAGTPRGSSPVPPGPSDNQNDPARDCTEVESPNPDWVACTTPDNNNATDPDICQCYYAGDCPMPYLQPGDPNYWAPTHLCANGDSPMCQDCLATACGNANIPETISTWQCDSPSDSDSSSGDPSYVPVSWGGGMMGMDVPGCDACLANMLKALTICSHACERMFREPRNWQQQAAVDACNARCVVLSRMSKFLCVFGPCWAFPGED